MGSSPTRPTKIPRQKRSDLGKHVFLGCFACGVGLVGCGERGSPHIEDEPCTAMTWAFVATPPWERR